MLSNFSYAQQKISKIQIEEKNKIESKDKDEKKNQYESSTSSENDFESVTTINGKTINNNRAQIQQSKQGDVSLVEKNSKIKRFFKRVWTSVNIYCKRNNISKKKLYNFLLGNLH